MKSMRKKLEDITNQHQCFSFRTDSSFNVQQLIDKRETDSKVEEVVGRIEEKQKILDSLSDNTAHEAIILPLYGIGGVGKTTLARWVFNSTQFRDYCKVWVYVSQVFDYDKIGNAIISQVSEEQSQINGKQMIHIRLTKLLADKSILIILDDLLEKDPSQLGDLKGMLNVAQSSKVVVIVTTRDEGIANQICTVKPYKIEPLTNDLCWTIIKKRCAFEARHDKEMLELTGRAIAEKCGGVALAAQSLGYMLHSMTSDEWESVKKSDIWNAFATEDASSPHHVPTSLKLSYINMPPYLKLCFSFCTIFPKGQRIAKNDLIHQWISLGFIESDNIRSTWQLGEKYVRHLLGMSFLQHPKTPLHTGEYMENVEMFTMHDLVHDLARSVIGDEFLDAGKISDTERSNCRYALLTDCSQQLKLFAINPAKIRAIRFLHCNKIGTRVAEFAHAKFLRVLDLSECYIQDLPQSIGDLKQLRYLKAPRIRNLVFPTWITNLWKLKYLNLTESSFTTLPLSIGQIKCLAHLDLSWCSNIRELPKSFVLLKCLVHLDLSNCRYVEIIPELLAGFKELVHLDLSNCKCVKSIAEALGGLTNLQFLNLARRKYGKPMNLTGLPGVIINLTKLRYLGLSGTMHSIFGGPSTERIVSFIEHISTLSNLEHLDLSGNYSIVRVPENIASLKKLHTLDLTYCTGLLRLPESMLQMGNLKILNVKGCQNLDESTLPRSNLFVMLPSFVVGANDGESSSNLCVLHNANPVNLKISRLENVKSIDEAFSINLMRKQRMRKLQLKWTRDGERSVEDDKVLGGLVPPSSLEEFGIQGYKSATLPVWTMGISSHLPNVVEIKMWDLPNCNSLPPLGQLPNLKELIIGGLDSLTKIDEAFYGGARAFPELKEFQLIGMERLEEWKTTYSCVHDGVKELIFPNLERLTTHGCPKLRLNPCPPRSKEWNIEQCDYVISSWGQTCVCSSASWTDVVVWVDSEKVPLHQCLPALTKLCIKHCSGLRKSGEIFRDLSALQSLILDSNNELKLPKWLNKLMSLRKLTITGIQGIDMPPDIIVQLTSLQSLKLKSCTSMTRSPQWLGELVSLKKLEISGCPKLDDLQNMQYLTTLQKLTLKFCESILALPEWLGELTSLQELYITGCWGIKTLPESIDKLTKLEILSISLCYELEEWCHLEQNKMKLAHIKYKDIDNNYSD